MKSILSMQQVNENLRALKDYPNCLTNIPICYSIQWHDLEKYPTFYLWMRSKGIIVVYGKQVFWRSFIDELITEYTEVSVRFKGYDYVIEDNKKVANLWLTACGMRGNKDNETDIQRLRKLAGQQYCNIYQVMKQNWKWIYSTELEHIKMNYGAFKMHLVVKYKIWNYGSDPIYGKWQFPVESVGTAPCYDEEIQNIFFNLLDIPVTTKQTA